MGRPVRCKSDCALVVLLFDKSVVINVKRSRWLRYLGQGMSSAEGRADRTEIRCRRPPRKPELQLQARVV
jgi:hypothetical protein